MKSPQEVSAIIGRLKELYPDAACSLDYDKDYELLFSVRLAAQCTDARVNQVTPALFARFPTLEAFAAASGEEVGEYVRSCGFWRRAGAGQHDGPAAAAGCGSQDRQPDFRRRIRSGGLRLRHPLHPHHRAAGPYRRQPGPGAGGAAAAPVHPAGGVQRFLPPDGASRPGRVHGPKARLRRLHPAGPVRFWDGAGDCINTG